MTQEEIYEKHPEIFKEKDLTMQETCMCWGLCVPVEWLPIIDVMCKSFGSYLKQHEKPQVVAQFQSYYKGHVDGCIAMANTLIRNLNETEGENN